MTPSCTGVIAGSHSAAKKTKRKSEMKTPHLTSSNIDKLMFLTTTPERCGRIYGSDRTSRVTLGETVLDGLNHLDDITNLVFICDKVLPN